MAAIKKFKVVLLGEGAHPSDLPPRLSLVPLLIAMVASLAAPACSDAATGSTGTGSGGSGSTSTSATSTGDG
ncbi:MAG: hypothetical protein ACXWEV_06845, partial [Methylobacter sp.]